MREPNCVRSRFRSPFCSLRPARVGSSWPTLFTTEAFIQPSPARMIVQPNSLAGPCPRPVSLQQCVLIAIAHLPASQRLSSNLVSYQPAQVRPQLSSHARWHTFEPTDNLPGVDHEGWLAAGVSLRVNRGGRRIFTRRSSDEAERVCRQSRSAEKVVITRGGKHWKVMIGFPLRRRKESAAEGFFVPFFF
ncbi:alcohol dehydrogenase [Striga asiatica]|uniref:Alcohol dehydrogenase n=1 Tax=Striga asiatica TaxID=4170 RepID=A0A5A7NXD5_STRAF|nr:alcohol dehydrogenase [Striga asiatica]